MKRILLLLLLIWNAQVFGQTGQINSAVTGRLYVDVDDGARIFINGQLAHNAGIDTSISPEVTIQPGDRIVAQLFNNAGGKWFKLVFLASDQKSAISFQRSNFKIIGDVTVVDFTPADWPKWVKFAKTGTHKRDRLPVKNSADEVWGEGENTSLGTVITADMFKRYAAPDAGQNAGQVPVLMTIEAFVDGPSTLHIRQDGIYWANGQHSKPGVLKYPTYVNGKEWTPKWGNPGQERGFDRSDVYPFRLESLDVSVELVSNLKDREGNMVDPKRTPIQVRRRPSEIEVVIPDPESGQRWYKLSVRGRKR